MARQAFRAAWLATGAKPDIDGWLANNKDNYPMDKRTLLRAALEAEIAEEQYLHNQFFNGEDTQCNHIQIDRFAAHTATENTWILSNYTLNKWYGWVGEAAGTFNAVINAAITAAVTATMIQALIPLVFGLTITNPLVTGIILLCAAVAGFTSSYTLTRTSIVSNLKKLGRTKLEKQILKQTKQTSLNDRLIEIVSIIGGIGLGVLSGLQVQSLVLIYLGTNMAIAAGLIVGAATFLAVYSLFYEYNKAAYANDQKNTRYLATFFPDEHINHQKIQRIKWHERIVGISAALLTGLLVMVNTGTIVVASTTAIGALYLTKLVLAKYSLRGIYKKPKQTLRNLLAESGLTLTIVHATCLCISVSLGMASVLGTSVLSSGYPFSLVYWLLPCGQYVWRIHYARPDDG